MGLLRKWMGGGVGRLLCLTVLAAGVGTYCGWPVNADDANVYIIWPIPGCIYPCAVGSPLSCEAVGGPAPGTYSWTVAWTLDGQPGQWGTEGLELRNLMYPPSYPVVYSVSVSYSPSAGGGPAHDDGPYLPGR